MAAGFLVRNNAEYPGLKATLICGSFMGLNWCEKRPESQ